MNVSRPELARILQEAGGDELLESVARQIVPYMGATRRFVDFMNLGVVVVVHYAISYDRIAWLLDR